MTKLTNKIREHIVKAAITARYAERLQKQFESVKEQIISVLKDAYKGLEYDHAGVYRDFINWHTEVNIADKCFPKEWDLTWDTFRNICGIPSINSYELPFRIPSREEYRSYVYLDDKYAKQVKAILSPFMVQYLSARAIWQDMQSILQTLTTYQQVRDTFPELAEFLPASDKEAVKALIPIEQINRIRRAFKEKTNG